MVGSAGWRWCNVLALVTPAASSAGPQDKEQTKGGFVPLHDCLATDCHTSVGLGTTRPQARPAETVVNAFLDIGSTLAVRPEHATQSNNARSARGTTVKTVATSSSGASFSEQDAFHLRSRETLHVPECVIEETVVEKNNEESKGNVTFVVKGASSSNSWLDCCVTADNLVPYIRSNSNANTSALQNNFEKFARLNQDQDPPPWFSHYGEDMYDHVTRGLIYIETSIPGPGLDMDTFQQMPHGCNCQEGCSKGNGREAMLSSNADASVNRSDNAPDRSELVHKKSKREADRTCSSAEGPEKLAVLSSGRESVALNSRCSQDGVTVSCGCSCSDRTPASYRNGLLVQPNLPWPIYECNDDCHCPSSATPRSTSNGCQNRVVQRGPRRNLVIRKAKGNTKRCLAKNSGESSVACDSQQSKGNGVFDVSMDSQKNLCKRQVFLSDYPERKSQSHPVASCQSGVSDSLSFIDQVHQSNPRDVSVYESVSKRSTNSPDKGLGVFTELFIPRGSFICEYAGELLGEEEARYRFARQEREGKSNYILVLREFYGEDNAAPTDVSTGTKKETPKYSSSNHSLKYSQRNATGPYCNVTIPNRRYSKNTSTKQDTDFMNEGSKHDIFSSSSLKPAQVTIIDPTSIGNIGRYLNHSCDPNTQVVPVRVNSVIPVAAMFAVRDVLPGEELVYDYGSVREVAALYWTDGQPTNAAGDVDGLGSMSDDVGDSCSMSDDVGDSCSMSDDVGDSCSMSDDVGDSCSMSDYVGIDRSKSSENETHGSLEVRGANAAPSVRHTSLDAGEINVGLQKRILKHDPCWGQHRSTEKKQKLDSASSSGSVEVKTVGSKTDKPEWVTSMAIVDFDVTRKSPCLCGAQNCRGYLPAEVDLF